MRTLIHDSDLGIRLECEYLPAYGYADFMAGLDPVASVAPLALGEREAEGLELEIRIPELRYQAKPVEEETRTRFHLRNPNVASFQAALEAVAGRTPTHWTVHAAGKEIGRTPITLLSPWEWSHALESRRAAAAYALPGDETVGRIVTSAQTPGDDGGERRSLPESVRRRPAGAAALALEAIYHHLAEQRLIEYEDPRLDPDSWCGMSHQKVRPPGEIFSATDERNGRGNCLDLSLLLAGCLEALGLHPLILFVGDLPAPPDHAFLGCWTDHGRRFRPILGEPAELAAKVDQGELVVLEATGVCQGSRRLSYDDAKVQARARLDGTLPIHALDVRALRPPDGTVRSLLLPNDPVVQRAYWLAEEFATSRRAGFRETLHLLYGLCAVGGPLLPGLLERCGSSVDRVRGILQRNLEAEGSPQPPKSTKNHQICVEEARRNARARGASAVQEPDLLWAILDNPSRNIQKVLSAAGCDLPALSADLALHSPPAGEGSFSRSIEVGSSPRIERTPPGDPPA